jgi:hypothetical protein
LRENRVRAALPLRQKRSDAAGFFAQCRSVSVHPCPLREKRSGCPALPLREKRSDAPGFFSRSVAPSPLTRARCVKNVVGAPPCRCVKNALMRLTSFRAVSLGLCSPVPVA